MNETKFLYKILTENEWEEFKVKGIFDGSSLDKKDGFIHASFEDQYPKILEKFFKSIRPVILVKINTELLELNSLKIEANKANGIKYPHIYGNINLNAICSSEIILVGAEDLQTDKNDYF